MPAANTTSSSAATAMPVTSVVASPVGANPMRWDCSKQGCFNLHKRPKIEMFADCLPGRIAFSDVDAIVEVGGHLLAIEWKEHRHVPRGQHLLFTRWTKHGPVAVIMVVGDARNMTVEEIALVHKGVIGPWQDMDMAGLRQIVQDWATWAVANPVKSGGEGK